MKRLFSIVALLLVAVAHAAPVDPIGKDASGRVVPATRVLTSLLSGPLTCDVSSSALPTGAATEVTLASLAATIASISALQLPAALVSGRLDVNLGAVGVTVPVSGTFWQATQPVSAASLPLPTGAATETTLAKLTQTQGSSTSGQSGPLVQAAVTTSAPTYTNGQTAPLSQTTGGALRVSAVGTTVTPVSQSITARDVASSTTTGQNSQTIVTGTPTANSAASFTLVGVNTARLEITGTWTGTLTSELTNDGVEWHPIGVHLTGTPLTTSTFTANGGGNLNVAGALAYRLRATAAWTGTATVTVTEAAGVSTVYLANAIRLIDSTTGSTTQANVVAASTAVPSTATSLSVGLNPNSPTPKFADGTCSGTLTNGNPTLTCSSLQGVSTGGFHLAYGSTGSIGVACSFDGTNYSTAMPMAALATPGTQVTSVSASGDWFFQVPGCTSVRFTLTGGTGSHSVTARFTGASPPVMEEGGIVATASNQTSGAQKTQQVDASGNVQPAGDGVSRPIYQARVGASAFQLLTGLTAGTTLRSGVGTLRKMCVFIPSSGGTGGFYVYDNTAASGTAIVSLFTTTSTCYDIDARFATGLTVQMTTAAATVLMTWDTY